MAVQAATDVVGASHYSRRERQGMSGVTLPGVRSRTPRAGILAAGHVTRRSCTKTDQNAAVEALDS
jgi:hypothetical protein